MLGHDEFVQLIQEASDEDTELEGVHMEVLVPRHFDAVQRKTIWEVGALSGITVCKFYNQLKLRRSSAMCGSRLSVKRSSRIESAGKPRGPQGSHPVEAESRLSRGSSDETYKAVSEMLSTANSLLQAAHQLLQQGPGVQGS